MCVMDRLGRRVLIPHTPAREADQTLTDLGRSALQDIVSPPHVFALPQITAKAFAILKQSFRRPMHYRAVP
jgi:hypothetical protein